MIVETLADVTPVTVYPMGHSGLPKRAKKTTVTKKPQLTVAALRELVAARGLKALTAHTKAELAAMLKTGVQVRPAAYDRQNAARKAKRAGAK